MSADEIVVTLAAVAFGPIAWITIGRPSIERPHLPFATHGLGLGLVYVAFAILALQFVGWPA
jgi:hypothetical protein